MTPDDQRPDGGYFGGGTPPPPPPGSPPPAATPPPPGAPPPPSGGPPIPPPPGSPPVRAGRRVIPLHPLTVGDIFDGAFKLYRGTFAQVAIVVLVLLGVLQLISSLALRQLTSPEAFMFDPTSQTSLDPFDAIDVTGVAIAMAAGLVTLLVTPLVNGAVTWLAARYDLGEDRSWSEGISAAASRFGALLGAAVLIILLGIALLIAVGIVVVLPAVAIGQASVPAGIIVGVLLFLGLAVPAFLALTALFYLVVPVIVVENLGAMAALRRSARLVRPQMWRIVGIVVLAGLLIGVVSGVLGVAVAILTFVGGPASWLIEAIGNTAVQMLVTPVAANIALLLYVDARVRREGLDIEILTRDLPVV